MKLYYDNDTNEILEGGIINLTSFTRNKDGNLKTGIKLDNLTLLGEIYPESITLNSIVSLSKIVDGEDQLIINGLASEKKIQGGLRFNIHNHRGFNNYSTNIVVNVERLGERTIDFYTLSGSHYRLDILDEV